MTHTLNDIFRNASAQKSNKPFINFGNETLTYGELSSIIKKYTTYFIQNGISENSRVIISTKNESLLCSFYLSLLANGITVIYIDPETGAERANAIINHCETPYIFVDSHLLVEWDLYSISTLKIVDIQFKTKSGLLQKFINGDKNSSHTFPACVDKLPDTEIPIITNPDADAYILFTSGTTSSPKGVRVSYRALLTHLETLTGVYQIDAKSRLFNNLILSHADGMIQGPLMIFYKAATLYRPFAFSIQRIEDSFDIIYREKISHWLMVPTMISLIHQFKKNDNDTLNISNFKHIISCGGKLEPQLWSEFEEKFRCRAIIGYGLTETVADCLFAGPSDETHIVGSVGKPINCEVRIVDEHHNDCLNETPGEIWLRAKAITSGYLNDPDATSKTFEGEWFKTGDLGFLGNDGCYRISGRKKLVIISGGLNISPEEITEVINTHPMVAEAVTFGIDEDTWGEIVVSAIVTKKLATITKDDIIAHCRKQLEERKIPTKLYFVDSLPYGRSGKVIINEIKKLISEIDENSIPNNDTNPQFLSIVSRCFQMPVDKVNLEMIAEDTPEWDSISHLIMIAEMERQFSIQFTPLEVMNIKILADLLTIVENKVTNGEH